MHACLTITIKILLSLIKADIDQIFIQQNEDIKYSSKANFNDLTQGFIMDTKVSTT